MKAIGVKKVSGMLGGLGLLKFFPSDKYARAELTMLVCEMASDESQVEWLVRRMRNLYQDWPGPRELRAVFCSKFKPKDGIEVDSDIYLDGVPSEREQLPQLAAPAAKYLPAPEEAPMNPAIQKRMEQLMVDMKARMQMPKPKVAYPTAAEIQAVKEAQERNRKMVSTIGIPEAKESPITHENANGGHSGEVA